ncbi:MAG: T9SS type A sorting domain-containing protein [Bacteroidota bacterium]|nr:T9SS type A sorting domain-containing protein [Bacteroidota bacterium]
MSTNAQSLKLRNLATGQIITDTVIIQSTDNGGWVGAESLDLAIIVENVGLGLIEVGARKIEYEQLQSNVQHTICFAGQCYDVSTFESTFHAAIAKGSNDSSFLAHYLFDNKVHVRGINHIAYVFYDVNNPNDSSVVQVIYNTVVVLGVTQEIAKYSIVAYPNPAKDILYLSGMQIGKESIIMFDILGNKVYQTNTDETAMSVPLSALAKGVYILSVGGQVSRVVVE